MTTAPFSRPCATPLPPTAVVQEPLESTIAWTDLVSPCLLGEGNFGKVERFMWTAQKKYVAVKTSLGFAQERLHAEAKALRVVDHPNVIKLWGISTPKPTLWALVLEFADQGSLHDVLYNITEPLLLANKWTMAIEIAEALTYLHSRQIVHRDLKPENVLLTGTGSKVSVRVCDFGHPLPLIDETNGIIGTTRYMASFDDPQTEKMDVFSFGILLWELLTEKRPFDDIRGGPWAIAFAVTAGSRPPLAALDKVSPTLKGVQTLIERCWDPDPKRRPSFGDVVKELKAFRASDRDVAIGFSPSVGVQKCATA